VFDCAALIARELKEGEEGVYIFGGEPTVELPEEPGEGGRAQCLSLALSKDIQDLDNLTCLIAGTDGTDGPTDAAGGIVDCHTFSQADEATEALQKANSGAYLRSVDALFVSGPTGTNVMDIAVCLKISEEEAQKALEKLNQ
jgi:glycerate 2-kinase